MPSLTLEQLRRFAIARSMFTPTSLNRAIHRLGFVQADPIRAPARAQDLTLRHRVNDYHAGDLERCYAELPIEEDFFVNYGFLPRATQALMHPRTARQAWSPERWQQAYAVQKWVAQRSEVHPREVDAQFAQGTAQNWFGGQTKASTQLLDGMHYRGLLRVAKRDSGVRVYAHQKPMSAAADSQASFDALIDVAVAKYAPVPAATLGQLLTYLCVGVPQWRGERSAALLRAKKRLSHAVVEGIAWYWPTAEKIRPSNADDAVRLLAPFDPVVWDRRRFELFWGWAYRFEAYTPAPKRKLGYYAMPLLWRDQVIGWGNLASVKGVLTAQLGYVNGQAPGDAMFQRELAAELERIAVFLKPKV